MRITKFLVMVIAVFLFVIAGCYKDDKSKLGDCKLEKSMKSASDLEGTIWYDNLSQRYSVFSSLDGTYDSQDVGICCNLPDDFQTDGLEVLFSGNYYECVEFSPAIVGQTYYFLEITKIKQVSRE
ncbi:MAG: hypothetical protein R2757_21950 [Draconibacterium sp.]